MNYVTFNEAPHSSELTLEQKEIIVQLSKEGYSSHKIQSLIGILKCKNHSEISETCKRNTGTVPVVG